MKKEIGLWIDHREAVVVVIAADKGEETRRIESGIEEHVRFSGGAKDVTTEDIHDRKFANRLGKYYDEVIASIRDADSILIFGPGEAKDELKKRLESQQLGGRIIGIEAADKMTDRQITAKVRQRFLA